MRHFILYNPTAGRGHADDEIKILKADIGGECILLDVTKEGGYAKDLADLALVVRDKNFHRIPPAPDGALIVILSVSYFVRVCKRNINILPFFIFVFSLFWQKT